MEAPPRSIHLRAGYPDFLDLPWNIPLAEWGEHCSRLENVPRGLSRHPVAFVVYDDDLYAFKEMPPGVADREYKQLMRLEELRLPAVTPVGHFVTDTRQGLASVLVTVHLDRALPYRSLFMNSNLGRYREHFLSAMAGLLVELHLAGVFWGDCSLSNTLFRRDAGALRAYLVDGETVEIHPPGLAPNLRFHDLQVMEENISGELTELRSAGLLPAGISGIPVSGTAASIRDRYRRLWDEIKREVTIGPDESFRIQERIRALNALGFSVGEVKLTGSSTGNELQLRAIVTDRNYHRDELHGLTGLEAEEMQARQMMNEIRELQAVLSQSQSRSIPLNVAAYYWLENIYQPAIQRLKPIIDEHTDPAELYCQVLEHKWYLSEQAHEDVGHEAAVEDFSKLFNAES